MNYIKQLAGFFDRVVDDEKLNPTHVSMYVALFQFWNACHFRNPISISRNELMKVSKISSKATYHKCMKELHNFGYLKYMPSYNPYKGSLVYLFNFETSTEQLPMPNHTKNQTSTEQAPIRYRTKIDTSTELAQEPYTNNTNILNKTDENLGKHTNTNFCKKVFSEKAKEKSSSKKEKLVFIEPVLKSVQVYFSSKKYPSVEAEKFYNYFQSNGWLVGGKTAMKNWQAAANNWMLNAQKFANLAQPFQKNAGKPSQPKAKQLHATTSKNYKEPL